MVKRILQYLIDTHNHGLYIQCSPTLSVNIYTDADWGKAYQDRKSTTSFAIYVGDNLISWWSKKKTTIWCSSTEAKYRALATAMSEVLWLLSVLNEIGLSCSTLPRLWCDNISATYLMASPIFHSHSQHLEIELHLVRDLVFEKQLMVSYIPTDDQLVDLLTKPLTRQKFLYHCHKLNVSSTLVPTISLQGSIKDKVVSSYYDMITPL